MQEETRQDTEEEYQRDARRFFEFAIAAGALQFGEFTLKSGRISPYFFNAGLFHSGSRLATLGGFYGRTILRHIDDDFMLYGPAYKGIALASATAMALATEHQREVHYAFNRKEEKQHGEGGGLIGAPLRGAVVIVDDVITAGLSVAAAVQTIEAAGARPAAVVIALDREERAADTNESATAEVARRFNIPVYAVARFSDLPPFLAQYPQHRAAVDAMRLYHQQYGTGAGAAAGDTR